MANITKKVMRSPNGASGQYQSWNTAVDLNDLGGPITAGDIFRITESLYRPADHIMIITGDGAVSIRINSIVKIYPNKPTGEFKFPGPGYKNLAGGQDHHDTSMAPFVIEANKSLSFNEELKVNNIEIVSMAANFKLLVD
jgi:hypothetical protein